jgi:hypothetical protein
MQLLWRRGLSVTARNLERGKQDQEYRHVLGEVGVRPHPPQHHVITAIADANLQWPARSNDTGTQPHRAAAAAEASVTGSGIMARSSRACPCTRSQCLQGLPPHLVKYD